MPQVRVNHTVDLGLHWICHNLKMQMILTVFKQFSHSGGLQSACLKRILVISHKFGQLCSITTGNDLYRIVLRMYYFRYGTKSQTLSAMLAAHSSQPQKLRQFKHRSHIEESTSSLLAYYLANLQSAKVH